MKSLYFTYILIWNIFWVFINNILLDLSLSLYVLLFIAILFLSFSVYYKKYYFYLLTIIIWFILWLTISYYNNIDIQNNKNYIDKYINNSKYELILKIDWLANISTSTSKYIVKLRQIDSVNNEKNIYWQIRVPNNYKLKIWSIIKVKSKLSKIENFWNFDYKNYMFSKGIYFNMDIYSLDLIDIENQNIIYTKIWEFRKQMLSVIDNLYTKNEAIFLWWILLWARESMPSDLKTDFNNSWLAHLIAVSGFNITILIVFFSFILKYFPVYIRIILITLSVLLFIVLVWDTAPVIRASIMWLIAYYILMSWRSLNAWIVILFSITIMIIYNPLILNYDVSFQLSFLAVLWIIFTKDYFDKIFYFLPKFFAIQEAFVLTLSAMVFSLPIMIFDFGQLSILAPIANIAVAWTIAPAMLLGFLSIMLFYIHPFFWYIFWYLDWVLLKYDILMVRLFWNSTWAIIEFDFWIYKNYLKILYFIIVSFLLLYFRK